MIENSYRTAMAAPDIVCAYVPGDRVMVAGVLHIVIRNRPPVDGTARVEVCMVRHADSLATVVAESECTPVDDDSDC